MRANVETTTPGMERCVSCDASLFGPYCSRCGERALEPEALTLRHFLVHTVAHELLHVDAARERFHDRLDAFAEPVSFANVVLLAGALHLCFRRQRRRFLEHAAFSMHFVSFVLLSSLTLVLAIRLRFWLGGYLFLVMALISLWQFAYLAIAIRRFYLQAGRWGARLLSVAAAM